MRDGCSKLSELDSLSYKTNTRIGSCIYANFMNRHFMFVSTNQQFDQMRLFVITSEALAMWSSD